MTLPEKTLRKLYGFDYDEFGAYGDQQIRLQVAEMCAEGLINDTQALNAMVEKSGTIWEMAADRQRKANELRVPLFAGAEAAKGFTKGEVGFGEMIAALGSSLLGGRLFPTGEQELRTEKALKDQAYIDKANGDLDAVNRFYDENPAYNTYSAVYMADDEELLKYVLYQNISRNFWNEPYERQRDLANQMGSEFRAAIYNKETRNYKAVPVEKLARWNAQLGGTNPNIGTIDVKGVERVMRMSDQAVDVFQEYNNTINTTYAAAKIYEDMYYQLPKGQERKAFLEQVPELRAYWDYKDRAKEIPEIKKWLGDTSNAYDEDMCCNSYSDMSEYSKKALEYSKVTGKDMDDTAKYELQQLYKKYGGFKSYEEYVKLLKEYK